MRDADKCGYGGKYFEKSYKLKNLKSLRIVSWNCQGAFRKKYQSAFELNPDILVIQECESIDRLKGFVPSEWLDSAIWVGDKPAKGLAVFAKPGFKLQILDCYQPIFRHIVPIVIEPLAIRLFAVWAMNDAKQPKNRYIAQAYNAIEHYDTLVDDRSVFVGDWNSNVIWDNDLPKRTGNHTEVIEKLSAKNIHSLYHKLTGEEAGAELQKTLFMSRNKNRGYHIDYCFAHESLIPSHNYFEIASFDKWADKSDHVPLSIKLKVEKCQL